MKVLVEKLIPSLERDLRNFLVEAKRKGYAGNGKEKITHDGSRLITFQEGNFYYEDNYFGESRFQGVEKIRWKKSDGQILWQMAYSGGMLHEFVSDEKLIKETFDFLKKALLEITVNQPFRGPSSFLENEFGYYNLIEKNDLLRFKGIESIKKDREFIYSLDYIGGSPR